MPEDPGVGQFVSIWVAIFLYGIARFPITRGTSPRSIDGGGGDLLYTILLWGVIGLILASTVTLAQIIG